MTDLIQRLREKAHHRYTGTVTSTLLNEVADELERMRDQRDALHRALEKAMEIMVVNDPTNARDLRSKMGMEGDD